MMPFLTSKPTNFKKRCFGLAMNLLPTYRRTGGRLVFVSYDMMEVHVRLKLGWGTKNYVGTLFGGSMASAADPIYMLQLIQLLGKDYIVWDKSGSIQFKRPGNQTLFIRFLITDDLLAQIKRRVIEEQEFDLEMQTDWVDKTGKVYATLGKVIYIADKKFYKEKQASRLKNQEL